MVLTIGNIMLGVLALEKATYDELVMLPIWFVSDILSHYYKNYVEEDYLDITNDAAPIYWRVELATRYRMMNVIHGHLVGMIPPEDNIALLNEAMMRGAIHGDSLDIVRALLRHVRVTRLLMFTRLAAKVSTVRVLRVLFEFAREVLPDITYENIARIAGNANDYKMVEFLIPILNEYDPDADNNILQIIVAAAKEDNQHLIERMIETHQLRSDAILSEIARSGVGVEVLRWLVIQITAEPGNGTLDLWNDAAAAAANIGYDDILRRIERYILPNRLDYGRVIYHAVFNRTNIYMIRRIIRDNGTPRVKSLGLQAAIQFENNEYITYFEEIELADEELADDNFEDDEFYNGEPLLVEAPDVVDLDDDGVFIDAVFAEDYTALDLEYYTPE